MIVLSGELCHTSLNSRGDGVFGELVALDHSPCVEVEDLGASPCVTGGAEADAWRAVGSVGGVQWVEVIMHLSVCSGGETTVFRVVELDANNDVTWTVGVRTTSHHQEGIGPHHCECHDLDDHSGGEDAER